MHKILAACIQMNSSISIQNNIEQAVQLITQAAHKGAACIVTPEMTTLIDNRPEKFLQQAQIETADISLPIFQKLAYDLNITLIIGSIPIKVSPTKCVNRSFLINNKGAIATRYDKIHLFDVSLNAQIENIYRESDRCEAGNKGYVTNIYHNDNTHYKIGLSICYDVRFADLYRKLAQKGADIITVPAAFTQITGIAHWHVLLRARAIETGCFILAAAQCGKHEDGRLTYGHSMIINPWGEIIAEKQDQDVGIIMTELDLSLVEKTRKRIPCLQHDKTFSVIESIY
jgi:deaminated glutathione amidase